MTQCMTEKGRSLGFGVTWEVTPGKAWLMLGYAMSILTLHTGGPKKDLWLQAGDPKYADALYVFVDLGKYGIDYAA
jgi:hypothetical protein